jgi:thymidylate kinase
VRSALDAAGKPFRITDRRLVLEGVTGARLIVGADEHSEVISLITDLGAKRISLPDTVDMSAEHLLVLQEDAHSLVHVELAKADSESGEAKPVPAGRLATGGAMIAIVGGDGAGKSTVVGELTRWLGSALDVVPAHLGKPPRTVLGTTVKVLISIGRRLHMLPRDRWGHYPKVEPHGASFPGLAWLLWQVATAHDRRRLYRNVESQIQDGLLVVADRFPLRELKLMDGSRTRWLLNVELGRLAKRLVRYEQSCYDEVRRPDVVVVLRLDPEIAVARKAGVDPAEFVRPRSAEVFTTDWSRSGVYVVDASNDIEQVLSSVKDAVWQALP